MNVRVAAVVVNWNLKEKTLHCIQSIKQQSVPCRVILVDNGSTDNSTTYITHQIKSVEVLQFPDNLGFATACNTAIHHALADPACDFILLLNNDAIIHPHALKHLLHIADISPEVGILGPKIYDMNDPCRLWYAGARRRRFVLAAADTGRGEEDFGQYDHMRSVDYVFGAAMLIRREVFANIGDFDERFFLYLEDLDFCLRAQASGFSIIYVPQAHVWHHGSASTENNRASRRFYLVQSTRHFLHKHCTPASVGLIFLFWLAVFIREVIIDISKSEWRVVRASLKGLFNDLSLRL
jgi:GT2 family glycosyltransferase